MAQNDIKVPKENASGTFDEVVLTGAQIGLEKPATGNASSSQVVLGNDTRLSDARTPSSTLAHAASHAAGGSDPLAPSDIGLGATDDVTFNSATLNALLIDNGLSGTDVPFNGLVRIVDDLTTGSPFADFVANNNLSANRTYNLPNASGTLALSGDAPASHAHGNLTNDGKVGSTSGLPLVTTTAGAVTTLALGTAGQVLRTKSDLSGVEFADPSGGGGASVMQSIAVGFVLN